MYVDQMANETLRVAMASDEPERLFRRGKRWLQVFGKF